MAVDPDLEACTGQAAQAGDVQAMSVLGGILFQKHEVAEAEGWWRKKLATILAERDPRARRTMGPQRGEGQIKVTGSMPSESPKTADDFNTLYATLGVRVSPDDAMLELV